MDCLERLDWKRVNKKVIESLVKSGAFDWTGIPRRALFETIPGYLNGPKTAEEKNSNQTSLFGMMGSAALVSVYKSPIWVNGLQRSSWAMNGTRLVSSLLGIHWRHTAVLCGEWRPAALITWRINPVTKGSQSPAWSPRFAKYAPNVATKWVCHL